MVNYSYLYKHIRISDHNSQAVCDLLMTPALSAWKLEIDNYFLVVLIVMFMPFLFLWPGSSGFWALPAEYCQLPPIGNMDEERRHSLVISDHQEPITNFQFPIKLMSFAHRSFCSITCHEMVSRDCVDMSSTGFCSLATLLVAQPDDDSLSCHIDSPLKCDDLILLQKASAAALLTSWIVGLSWFAM